MLLIFNIHWATDTNQSSLVLTTSTIPWLWFKKNTEEVMRNLMMVKIIWQTNKHILQSLSLHLIPHYVNNKQIVSASLLLAAKTSKTAGGMLQRATLRIIVDLEVAFSMKTLDSTLHWFPLSISMNLWLVAITFHNSKLRWQSIKTWMHNTITITCPSKEDIIKPF